MSQIQITKSSENGVQFALLDIWSSNNSKGGFLMDKVKVVIQSEISTKEIEVDGVVYTLLNEDEITKQVGFMPGFTGTEDPIILGNALAVIRNYVINILGVKPEQEDNFDKTIKEVAKVLK